MEKPDLVALAGRIDSISDDLAALDADFEAAYEASLGEDDDQGKEVIPGNGDTPEVYEAARKKVDAARFELLKLKADLAEQQGYRDFEVAGVA
jgi:hypothetical protein